MASKPKIKYVQLEAAAFLSDDGFQMMDAAERGIYCTIIFYMLCNNGRIKNDPQAIKKLCNVTSNFEQKWESVMSKLYLKGTWLRHRRVDSVLRIAQKKMQDAVDAGLKGAEKRWRPHKGSHNNPIANVNETKRKRNKGNTTYTYTEENSHSATSSLRFVDALERIIKPKDQSDRTSFKNLAGWIAENILNKKFNEDIYARILQYAQDAKTGRKPVAVFFATLTRELKYRKDK